MTKTNAKRLTKAERAALDRARTLEAAIVATLKRFGAQLKVGDYMAHLGEPGTCVCVIGAALLSRVPEYCGAGAARDLQVRLYKHFRSDAADVDQGNLARCTPMGPESRRSMARWAAEVVNDGIEHDDLLQLEEGFEGVRSGFDRSERMVLPDESSPFWKLGRKLGRRALRQAK